MSVATSTAIGIAAGVGTAGSVASAAIGSHAAGKAADTQAAAATQAAQIQAQSADKALAEQKREFDIGQQNLAPWLTQGRTNLANLNYLMGTLPAGSSPSATGQMVKMQPDGSPVTMTATNSLTGPISQLPHDIMRRGPGWNRGKFADEMPDFGSMNDVPSAAANITPNSIQDLSSLVNPALGEAGSLLKPFGEQFKAPDANAIQNDPEFQARLKIGREAIEKSAAARGGLVTGGTARDLSDYGQSTAGLAYGNIYNRAMQEYINRYNQYEQHQNDVFNRLSAGSGTGQQTANQLANLGQNYAANAGNIIIGSGNAQAEGINNAAAARASGYVGAGNAYGSAISGAGNNLMNLYLMNQILGGGGAPAATTNYGMVGVTG